MRGSLRRLISSYVRGRSAYVQTEDGRGQALECSSGVPQGSRLGPLLFSLYANSVFAIRLSPGTRLLAYADDLLMLKPCSTNDDVQRLQSDVELIVEHFQTQLGLRLNAKNVIR